MQKIQFTNFNGYKYKQDLPAGATITTIDIPPANVALQGSTQGDVDA
jgi:hypothetical protein